jgi:hypothetical protein
MNSVDEVHPQMSHRHPVDGSGLACGVLLVVHSGTHNSKEKKN